MVERDTFAATRDVGPRLANLDSLAPAITRGAAVMEELARMGGVPAGASELARRLDLPKSSISNICVTLVETGLLRRVGTGFGLGRKLAELGGAYLATVDYVQEFYDRCPQLPTASEETIQLAVLEGLEMVYVARHDGRQPVRLSSDVGRRLPASCTATGKVALASLDPLALDRRLSGVTKLPRLTRHSHRTVGALMDDITRIRGLGYAVDNEETMEGVVCYAVAISSRTSNGDPYAVSTTLLKARQTSDRMDLLITDLRALAAELANPLQALSSRHPRNP